MRPVWFEPCCTCCCCCSWCCAVVFDMHYAELLAKNEEITRLKAIIEGLGSSGDITYQQQQQQQQSQRQQQGQLSFGPG